MFRTLTRNTTLAILSLLTFNSSALATTNGSFANELVDILRPHVVSLDRTLVLFRYEEKRPQSFNPQNLSDVLERETKWSKRFFNSSIATNPDGGGPGLYTSTDPVATATWGFGNPALFVFSLRAHSNVLNGDGDRVTAQEKVKVLDLFKRMDCAPTVEMTDDYSDVVTKFRNAPNVECRNAMIEAFKHLKISAITYSFYSAPIEGCRATGTAINVVNPEALDLASTNYYTSEKTIEGSKDLTRFVSALFHETKSYFFTQRVLQSDDVVDSFRAGFGFLDQRISASGPEYATWKAQHILTCGAQWPTEQTDFRSPYWLNTLRNADPEYQELYVRTSTAYRARRFDLNFNLKMKSEFKLTQLNSVQAIQKRQLSRFDQPNLPESRELFAKLNANFPKLDKNALNHPLVLVFELQKMGINTAGQILVYNEMSENAGYPPVLSGSLPTAQEDASEFLRKNRITAMRILKYCRSVYLNTKIPGELIANGPCGVNADR